MSTDEVLRIVWLFVWGAVSVTCCAAGIALLNVPDAPGGAEWPIGIGVLFLGVASMLFEIFVIVDIWGTG